MQNWAKAVGVVFFEQASAGELQIIADRPVSLRVERKSKVNGNGPLVLSARLFVDASGLKGVLRKQVPPLAACCPAVPDHHLCSAQQAICEVKDEAGARKYLESGDFEAGAMVNHIGVAGGWSTISIEVSKDYRTVAVLAGCIAGEGKPGGPRMMKDLKAREPWIGKSLVGGAGLIPLRRPYDKLTSSGIALVGDSGCMVFGMHGSGVTNGLIAGRMLAISLQGASDPGDPAALWSYQANFMHEFGPILGSWDLFRRATQKLTQEDLRILLDSGIISPDSMEQGLIQAKMKLSFKESLGAAIGAFKAPRTIARLLPDLAPMPAVTRAYHWYPKSMDPAALRRWSRIVALLFKERPDVTETT